MKKIALLLVCVLASSLTFAARRESPNPKTLSGIGIIRSNSSMFKLYYKSEESSDVTVKILNASNVVVFSETIEMSNGFVRPYNFARLAEGTYTIKLDNGSNWMSEKIEYRKEKITEAAQVISLKDNKYLVLTAGNDDDEFSIVVSNSKGDAIYSGADATIGKSATLLNFKSLTGPFKFEILGSKGYSATIIR